MIARVVNVKDFPNWGRLPGQPLPFIYVGRVGFGFQGHPLANPFKLPRKADEDDRRECLDQYVAWLQQQPAVELAKLALDVHETNLPLACWCCTWDGESEPSPLCHAVVLAKEVTARLARREL